MPRCLRSAALVAPRACRSGKEAKSSGAARQVLEALLDKYADTGIEHIEDIKILQLEPFSQLGAPVELVRAFGGKPGYQQAIHDLEAELYGS